jgi:hypothetical protein
LRVVITWGRIKIPCFSQFTVVTTVGNIQGVILIGPRI